MGRLGNSLSYQIDYKTLFEFNPYPVFLFDLDGYFLSINLMGEKVLGRTLVDLQHENFKNFIHDKDREEAWDKFLRATKGEMVEGCELTVLRNGFETKMVTKKVPLMEEGKVVSVLVVAQGKAEPVMLEHAPADNKKELFKLITECEIAEKRIEHLVHYDTLTDLPNRALLKERLESALSQRSQNGGQVAVMFIDLDDFRKINETMGHITGDNLLIFVSDRLRKQLPEHTTIARISGDEFIVLIPIVSGSSEVEKTTEQIITNLAKPWEIMGKLFHMTASIGLAVAPEHGEDAENLIRHAEIAMYRAKDKGKNKYEKFSYLLNERITKNVLLEEALHQAIKNNEFIIHYQPIINSDTGEIVGAEALVRWNRPGIGMVPPAEFIPIAEKTGLIVPIGEIVLRSVCNQVKRWEDLGYKKIRVFVNLSTRQFQEPLFLQKTADIIKESGVTTERLGIEITESLIMDDVEFASQMLRELRDMEIVISIDDFGTGYSSLGYLKKLPADKLKIDQTFIRDIMINPDDEMIVNTIIALAKNLEISVVAEGVETQDQFLMLKEKKCDEVQGYLFSKPISAEDLETCFLKDDIKQGEILLEK